MNNRNKKEIVNEGIEVKGNEINYPNNCLFSPLQNVSVDTNVKKKNLHDNDSSSMYEFFGLSETGVQTDLTNRDIEELLHSKLCRLDQQELIEFLKAEEQFYQNNSNVECSSFLNHKRKKTNSKEEISISSNEKKEDKSTLNQLINTNNNNVNGQDIKKDNPNLSVNQNGNANVNGRKPIKKKIDAFILFKEEYRQMHKNVNEEVFEKVFYYFYLFFFRNAKKNGVNYQRNSKNYIISMQTTNTKL